MGSTYCPKPGGRVLDSCLRRDSQLRSIHTGARMENAKPLDFCITCIASEARIAERSANLPVQNRTILHASSGTPAVDAKPNALPRNGFKHRAQKSRMQNPKFPERQTRL